MEARPSPEGREGARSREGLLVRGEGGRLGLNPLISLQELEQVRCLLGITFCPVPGLSTSLWWGKVPSSLR